MDNFMIYFKCLLMIPLILEYTPLQKMLTLLNLMWDYRVYETWV